jgi:hypothetical protein
MRVGARGFGRGPAAADERRRAWLPAATTDGGARRKRGVVGAASRGGREGREGAAGFGARKGTKGWGAGGFFAKKPMRLKGWRAVLCKMAGAQSVAFRWRSGAPDLSFHSLHRWGGFHPLFATHSKSGLSC